MIYTLPVWPVGTARALLILDIDEVLVFSTTDTPIKPYDFRVFSYYVTKRPFVDEFLSTVFEWFEVAVWTSAGQQYAEVVVQSLIPTPRNLLFLWTSRRCTIKREPVTGDLLWLKDLKKVKRLGFRLERVLVVEDDARTMERNYGNLIPVQPFTGNLDDIELLLLLKYLEWIKSVENLRVVEKRNWRQSRIVQGVEL